MKLITLITLATVFLFSACDYKPQPDSPIVGTWQLLSHTAITKGKSEVTDYTKNQKMIKIINDTHFAFLNHTINTAKDSSNNFDGGGGVYTSTPMRTAMIRALKYWIFTKTQTGKENHLISLSG